MMSGADRQREAVNQAFSGGGDLLQRNGCLMDFLKREHSEVRQGDGRRGRTKRKTQQLAGANHAAGSEPGVLAEHVSHYKISTWKKAGPTFSTDFL